MSDRKLVAVLCELAPGMFSTECIFSVTMANGDTYRGISPRHFCWNEAGELISEKGIAQEAAGKVAAKILKLLEGNQVIVEVPDGELIAVRADHVQQRPTAIIPPKPEILTEPNPNVPVGS